MAFIKKMFDKVSKDSGAHQAIVDCIVERAKVLAVGCYKTIQTFGDSVFSNCDKLGYSLLLEDFRP